MQLSVVVPVYRSEDCLDALAARVGEVGGAAFESFELVLVNDCSPDRSWQVIERLAAEHDFVVGVNLRKNVGQDGAIMAGLAHARGDKVVIMDDDLQHDPADMPRLCAALDEGYDVAYAKFERKKQAWWKNLGSALADRAAVLVLDKPPDLYMSPYKAIRGEVVREVVGYEGPYPYVDGLLLTITRNYVEIPAQHAGRFAGSSNYNLARSIRVWLKLVTSFSAMPLRLTALVGAVIAVLSFLLGGYFLFEAIFRGIPVPGFPSLIVSVFFLGGIQLLGIGALGEYVGRMFVTINRRPQYTVKEVRRVEPNN